MTISKTERAEAIAMLADLLKPGMDITTTVLHVSKSGMSRDIMCQIAIPDSVHGCAIRDISWLVARSQGQHLTDNGGVRMGGCGMNMCFALVYNLGRTLYREGFGIVGHKGDKKRRATSKASAAAMVRAGWKFRGRNGDASGWDTDGGYALNYR